MTGCEARSLLHPYLLLLIYERPGHGYDLIDRLSCLGVSDVEPGHAYRVLRGMERARLVVSTWVPSEAGPARRRYELTEKGVADLEAWGPKLAHLGEVITSFLARWNSAARAAAPAPGGGREPRAVSWT
ncbi:helix-turn-helix transcriptional regulator [Actinomadura sp. LOL_016]|uniref:helix-turn-helix transcriptional regulator n=1 Tax=unclassified Actinomadura TaxID=2626254 RepID=UPI00174AE71C|nr:PadR family transcriptional regulator [Actinomadura cremea]